MSLILPSRLAEFFDYDSKFWSIAVTTRQILWANPLRWNLAFSATGNFGGVNGPVLFGLGEDVSSNPSLALTTRGELREFKFTEYGQFMQQAFWVANLSGTAEFAIVEITLQARTREQWVQLSKDLEPG